MTEYHIDIRTHLRLSKSFVGLVRAIFYLNNAKSNIKSEDYLSASSNIYYSLFHLSAAFAYLNPKTEFDLQNDVAPMNATSNTNVKRMFNISHKDLPTQIGNIENNDILKKLQTNLEKFRDLRELATYGPYLQWLSGMEETDEKLNFHYRWVLQKEHFDITSENFVPFTEIFKICQNGLKETEELIVEFREYFKIKKEDYSWYHIQMALYAILPSIPFMLAPTANEKIIRSVENEIKEFVKGLTLKEQEIYEHSRHMFEDGIKKVKEGQINSEIRLSIKKPKDYKPIS